MRVAALEMVPWLLRGRERMREGGAFLPLPACRGLGLADARGDGGGRRLIETRRGCRWLPSTATPHK